MSGRLRVRCNPAYFPHMKKSALIPYVCGAGATTAGCELGPVVMKRMGLEVALRGRRVPCDWTVDPMAIYAGNYGASAHEFLPPPGDMARHALVLTHCRFLREQVELAVARGERPVTLGGDHSMAAGSIAGLARAYNAHGRVGVLWIDAHADINTPATSPSQSLHGMPVAALLGMGDADFAGLGGGPVPVLRPENIFYIGLRDVDPGETKVMDELGIAHFDATAVHEMGIGVALKRAMAHIAKNSDVLFLSLDLDAFDPVEAPAVGTPVENGLQRSSFLPALLDIMEKYEFAGLEVSEFNPTLAGADDTYNLLEQILTFMLAA